jgi:16S rRNA processing protein RimM
MVDDFSFPEEQFILVGTVSKPHGLRGDLKLHRFSDSAESLMGYTTFTLVDDQGRLSDRYSVEKSRMQGKIVVVKLAGVDDRTSAENLTGKGVLVNKNDLPTLEDDEYYWYQFIGLPVTTMEDEMLGTVRSIFSNGAQDILVVEGDSGELLIPMVDDIVKQHTEYGVVIAPPPGLLDINDAK